MGTYFCSLLRLMTWSQDEVAITVYLYCRSSTLRVL